MTRSETLELASSSSRPSKLRRRGSSWSALRHVATLALALVAFVYASRSTYNQDVTTLFLVYSFLAVGMYIPVVLGGHIDLAYNAYFAAGAYSVAIVASRTSWPLLVAIPLAVLASVSMASILGAVTARLSGFHLALATLAFGFAAYRWLLTSRDVTGGAAGIGDIPHLRVLGWELGRMPLIGLSLVLLWAITSLVANLRRRLVGSALRLQREALAAAKASGIATRQLQIVSLASGAAIACLAGILFALMNQFVLAESFSIPIVFIILFMPLLGGVGSPWGAVLGAFIISLINEGGSLIQGPGALVFGLVTLVVIIAVPGGILGLASSGRRPRVAGWGRSEP